MHQALVAFPSRSLEIQAVEVVMQRGGEDGGEVGESLAFTSLGIGQQTPLKIDTADGEEVFTFVGHPRHGVQPWSWDKAQDFRSGRLLVRGATVVAPLPALGCHHQVRPP